MCAVSVAIAEQRVFALSAVQLIERAEVFGRALERLDKRFDTADCRSVGGCVIRDPFAVRIQRVDVVLRRFIRSGEGYAASGFVARNVILLLKGLFI